MPPRELLYHGMTDRRAAGLSFEWPLEISKLLLKSFQIFLKDIYVKIELKGRVAICQYSW